MTGSEAPAVAVPAEEVSTAVGVAAVPPAEWWRHANGRWVVGDAGRQPEIVPVPSRELATTRPDTVVDGARLGPVTYRAVSLRGLTHQYAGTPRQDAYLVRPSHDGGWLVGCVADGVSGSPLSHQAADLVCEHITDGLAGALGPVPDGTDAAGWEKILVRLPWQAAVEAASAAVRTAATAHAGPDAQPLDNGEARQVMATTAVAFVLATVPGPDGRHAGALAVAAGDSSALLLTGGRWQPVTAVKNDGAEIASSAVEPLPRHTVVQPAVHWIRPGDALAVITDGLGDPLGSGGGVVGRFLATMWERPPDLLSFAEQAAFYRRSFTDDRTAVVAWVEAS